MSADARPTRCVVVVPVKPPTYGKSRLTGLADDHRRDLAEAFALDTVQAAAATPGVDAVLVVTDDHRLAASLRTLGCDVIPDGVSDDLNATLVQAVAEVARRWPGAVPVVLCADLPGLRPVELAGVLGEVRDQVAAGRAAFVRDHTGMGTTLYAAPADGFDPSFGVASAARHAGTGAVEVGTTATSVRTDVDDPDDLDAALLAGVGPHTTRASEGRATPSGCPARVTRAPASWRLRQDFFAVFFAVVFFVVLVLAGAFFAVDLLAVDLLAVDLLAVDLLAAFVAVFFAGAFFAVLVLDDFFAVDFLAVVVFAAEDEDAFFAGAADFEAVDFAVDDFLAAAPVTAAAAARTPGGLGIVAAVSLGSFFAPEMTSLSSLPAENFGTDFFFDFIRSPVWGLRTQRALRTAFSNDPKPVIATFSPLATSRVMVSSTDSSAWAACLRFPS